MKKIKRKSFCFPQRCPRINFMNITKICLGESAQLMRQQDLCKWRPDISWLFISQCPFLSHCVLESPSRCTWSNPKRTECSWAALSLAWHSLTVKHQHPAFAFTPMPAWTRHHNMLHDIVHKEKAARGAIEDASPAWLKKRQCPKLGDSGGIGLIARANSLHRRREFQRTFPR